MSASNCLHWRINVSANHITSYGVKLLAALTWMGAIAFVLLVVSRNNDDWRGELTMDPTQDDHHLLSILRATLKETSVDNVDEHSTESAGPEFDDLKRAIAGKYWHFH
jgi:hypothetical protein